MAFWDGENPGTKNMIEVAQRYAIPTTIISTKVTDRVTEEVTDK